MLAWFNQIGPITLILIGGLLSVAGAFWAQNQNDQQQREIIRLNEQITNTVTGGDSYPLVSPVFLARHGEQGDIRSFHLAHKGKFPVYDLEARITDIAKLQELTAKHGSYSMKDYMWQIHVGTIGRGYEDTLMDVPSPDREKMIFKFTFMARNGQFEQQSIYQKINGTWYTATRLEKDEKVVFEHADKGMPIQALSEFTQPILPAQ